MKKIKISIFSIFTIGVLSWGIISCNSEESTVPQQEILNNQAKTQDFKAQDLASDSDFITYVSLSAEEAKLPKNHEALTKIMKDGTVDTEEIEQLPFVIGYDTKDLFIEVQQKKLNALNAADVKWNLKKMDPILLTDAILLVWDQIDYMSLSDSNLCKRERRNCYGIANSTAIGAHFACGTLDLTIAAGIVCHGAVLAAHYYMNDNCDIAYERCIKDK